MISLIFVVLPFALPAVPYILGGLGTALGITAASRPEEFKSAINNGVNAITNFGEGVGKGAQRLIRTMSTAMSPRQVNTIPVTYTQQPDVIKTPKATEMLRINIPGINNKRYLEDTPSTEENKPETATKSETSQSTSSVTPATNPEPERNDDKKNDKKSEEKSKDKPNIAKKIFGFESFKGPKSGKVGRDFVRGYVYTGMAAPALDIIFNAGAAAQEPDSITHEWKYPITKGRFILERGGWKLASDAYRTDKNKEETTVSTVSDNATNKNTQKVNTTTATNNVSVNKKTGRSYTGKTRKQQNANNTEQ